MDRASTFSDPAVIKRLQQDFIPFAGDVAEFAWRRTEGSRWFMEAAGKVNYRVRSGQTVQGFYTLGADGAAYGFENVRSAKVVLNLLSETASAHARGKHPKVEIPPDSFTSIFTKSIEPKHTDVVRVFTRLRPVPVSANSLNKSLGRDHLWITGKDIDALGAAAASGNPFPMPRDLKMRLVRYNLIDNVRGQPDLWEASQVKKADLTVTPIGRSGGAMVYKLSGAFAMGTADSKRGIDGTIEGEIEVDPASRKLLWFRAFAEASAWGDSKFTAHAPSGKFPLVIGMLNVDDGLSKTVAPDAISLGDVYFSPSEK